MNHLQAPKHLHGQTSCPHETLLPLWHASTVVPCMTLYYNRMSWITNLVLQSNPKFIHLREILQHKFDSVHNRITKPETKLGDKTAFSVIKKGDMTYTEAFNPPNGGTARVRGRKDKRIPPLVVSSSHSYS